MRRQNTEAGERCRKRIKAKRTKHALDRPAKMNHQTPQDHTQHRTAKPKDHALIKKHPHDLPRRGTQGLHHANLTALLNRDSEHHRHHRKRRNQHDERQGKIHHHPLLVDQCKEGLILCAPSEQRPTRPQRIARRGRDLLGRIGIIKPQRNPLHTLAQTREILRQWQRHKQLRRHRHLRCKIHTRDLDLLWQHNTLKPLECLAIHFFGIGFLQGIDSIGQRFSRLRIDPIHARCLIFFRSLHCQHQAHKQVTLRPTDDLARELAQQLIRIAELTNRNARRTLLRAPSLYQNFRRTLPRLGIGLTQWRLLGRTVNAHDFFKIPRRIQTHRVPNSKTKLIGKHRGNHHPVINAKIRRGVGMTFAIQHPRDALNLHRIRGVDAAKHHRTLPRFEINDDIVRHKRSG